MVWMEILSQYLGGGDQTPIFSYMLGIDGDDEYALTITAPSSDPRVLVYVFGICTKVPPTRPGFIVPEYPIGTIIAVVSMMAALMLRNRVLFIKK